jgi:hypothetical protein
MLKLKIFLILFIVILGNLYATNYFVDSYGGNDNNYGTNSGIAWKTIAHVNDFSSSPGFEPGDIISFKCGQIFQGITLSPQSSGTEGLPILFNSYSEGDRPVIDRNAFSGDTICIPCVSMENNQSNIKFEGLKFIHGWLENIHVWGGSYNITINNCTVDSAIQGSYDPAAKGMIYVGGPYETPPHHWTITNSSISYSLYGHGMYWDGCKNVLLDHDTVSFNGANGIQIYTGWPDATSPNMADSFVVRYCVIKQNATFGNGETGLFINGATNSLFYYNVIENHSTSHYSGCIQIENDYGVSAGKHGNAPNNNSFYNNTLICHGSGHIAIYLGGDNAYVGIDSLYFKNNIIYSDDISCYAVNMTVSIGTNSQFTNNLYYPSYGSYLFHFGPTNGGNNYQTIDEWKTATNYFTTPAGGYEAGSVTDPDNSTFVNTGFTNLQLKNGSNAILTGTDVSLTQDILGKTVANPPDIGAYQNSAYLSGAISTNTILSGNVAVTGDVTSSIGTTLTISPGTTMKFAPGYSLYVNGQCNAVGNDSLPIKFTSLSGTSYNSWGSLTFDGHSYSNSGILDHVIVSNGNGIYCMNGVITITNSQINNCFGGIYAWNEVPNIEFNVIENPYNVGIDAELSAPTITENRITNTTTSLPIGIYTSEANSFISGNYISGMDVGAGLIESFTETGYFYIQCNNNITGNSYGLVTGFGGVTTMGGVIGQNDWIPAYNSVYSNTGYDIYTFESSYACGGPNYFGEGGGDFYTDETSSIDFDLFGYLTNDPCEGAWQINKNNPLCKNSQLNSSNGNILYGLSSEKDGKIDDAITFYQGMINNDNHTSFALSQLAYIKNKYSKPEITTYLEDLLRSSGKYYSKIKRVLANIYLKDNRFDDAITACNDVINHSSTDYDGRDAKFEKLFVYLNTKKNVQMASQILSELKGTRLTNWVDSLRIKVAENLINNATDQISYKLAGKMENMPQFYDLSQNYPNPFNPNTTIRYQIPKAGMVTLKVYDIIGREVTTLINENKIEGFYTVKFNASKLPSGVYIYQIRVNDYVSSKKMILLK